MEKRSKTIAIRVTQDEYEKLQKIKTKARLAEWMRERCLLERYAVKKYDPDLVYEVNKIGVNINQITKALHLNPTHQTQKIINELKLLNEKLDRIIEYRCW
ncbi:plasmid mobilization protein [Commensalibacter oyaizuii]|uniref:Plasmid mobilization relaxosome protein MobC n=1 Tax=Commensalibacter oyaizuii TaxID=3043873 RepID=A0ABT6Q452_9PROT|nr:plasmid mobilization relaxosome protein MobC [Commensalibacter sp. TBRC 16381]MDI2091883.1 plasmid mobilization relaxosome protein MobC [Commensalibacter sp. TBRC 16381]